MVLWKMGSLQDGWCDHYWTIHSDPILQACQGMSPIEETSNIFLQQTKPEVGHPTRCLTKGILPKCRDWSFRLSSLGIIVKFAHSKHLPKQFFLKSAGHGKTPSPETSHTSSWGERCLEVGICFGGPPISYRKPQVFGESTVASVSPLKFPLAGLRLQSPQQLRWRSFARPAWIGCEIRSKFCHYFQQGNFL